LDDNEFKTECYVSVRSKVRTNGECRCVSCKHSLRMKWIDTGLRPGTCQSQPVCQQRYNCICMYVCMYVCMCMYIYIYIYIVF